MIKKSYIEEICWIIIAISIGISSIIISINISNDIEEKKCVEFYTKNKYILENCKEYKEKLEKIKK